jgi:CubicO group peptidase (beta-lactamase class C family)
MVSPIDRLITSAVEQRIFPGAVVLVARNGALRHAAAYGSTMYADPGSQPVTLATRYDIASLTKMFTATAALRLYEAGTLALDMPVVHYLPDVAAHTVTVRHLLTHTSGLELRLSSLRHHDAAGVRTAVYATLPTYPPGTRTAYVNISSLLLGDVVMQAAGLPLDSAIRQLVLEPLDLRDTFFCPPEHLRAEIAPTEWDEEWRGCLVQGRVHDESAHALGEVAGHAGLFSTATDLWRFMQMWLDGGVFGGTRLLRPETVALATSYQSAWLHLDEQQPAIRCGLGWMLDRADIMGVAPAGSYGHTGFTGPVLVAIPAQHLAVVFLCNRTYPRRSNERSHLPVVAALVDAVLQGAD